MNVFKPKTTSFRSKNRFIACKFQLQSCGPGLSRHGSIKKVFAHCNVSCFKVRYRGFGILQENKKSSNESVSMNPMLVIKKNKKSESKGGKQDPQTNPGSIWENEYEERDSTLKKYRR